MPSHVRNDFIPGMFLSGRQFGAQTDMELLTRVLAGVIATWIPIEAASKRATTEKAASNSVAYPPSSDVVTWKELRAERTRQLKG